MGAKMPASAVATLMRVTRRSVDSIITRVVARAGGRVDAAVAIPALHAALSLIRGIPVRYRVVAHPTVTP
jgi:hypothetical protein